MSSIVATNSGFVIPPGTPVLRMADLIAESENLPAETTDLGSGVVVEKRGNFGKMVGDAQMSLRAKVTAMEAARVGGKAGQAMFDTFRKTHPEEFGAAAVARDKALIAGEPPPPPEAPTKSSAGKRVEVADGGTYEADPKVAANVAGGNDVKITGSAESDFISALYNCTAYGLAGDDTIEAYGNAVLDGGSGNDRISGYGHARIYGGEGDDRIEAYDLATVTDSAGDNDVHVYAESRVNTGAGNDRIQAGDRAKVSAGSGHNWVTGGKESLLQSGDGDDMLEGGVNSTILSGAGDDYLVAGRGGVVTAGTGDDRITVNGDATIHFNRGDGNDSIGGGQWGQAYTATDRLSSSVLSFGTGIVPADLTMTRQGNDLLVQVGPDSVTLKDVQRHGIPTMTFADGSVLHGADVENMVGPAEPYQPASQVLQRFFDAASAYNTQLRTTGTPV